MVLAQYNAVAPLGSDEPRRNSPIILACLYSPLCLKYIKKGLVTLDAQDENGTTTIVPPAALIKKDIEDQFVPILPINLSTPAINPVHPTQDRKYVD
jgi:hypothetical protein